MSIRLVRVVHLLIAGFLAADGTAQTPPARPKVVDRPLLEALFLGGVPAVESLDVDGRIVTMAELRRDAEGREIGPHGALEQFVHRLLRAELERRDAWLDDRAYQDAYDAWAQPYDSTPFTVRVVATQFRGFPSLELFQQRWRSLESFARTLPANTFDDAALTAIAAAQRPLLAHVGLEVEWWAHEAPPQGDERRDFATATAAAEQTLAHLRADVLPKDLPPGVRHERAGSARPEPLNPLQKRLREGDYTTLLRRGVAATWFAAKEGELVGPTRGTEAVYVARVHRRVEQDTKVDVRDARVRELLTQVLREERFRAWVDEVLARAIVRIPAARGDARR
jgi:hypothetical protein